MIRLFIEHIEHLLLVDSTTQSYQSLMVLMFSLQKHIPEELLVNIVNKMSSKVQSTETSGSLKSYLFIILEYIFSQRMLNKNVLTSTVNAMFNIEDLLIDHINDQIYIVSFLRAFLQIILNFYSRYPNDCKPFIPAFLGLMIE